MGLVRLLAALIQPYMPALSTKVLGQLNLPATASNITDDLIKVCFCVCRMCVCACVWACVCARVCMHAGA